MKRTAFLTVLVSMIFGAVSCQREIIPDGVTGDVAVSLSVSLPEAATKAIADGTNVDILYYEIWSDNGGELGKKLVGSTKERTEAKLFDLDLTLVSDQTYHFLFWAQVNGNDYYDVSDLTAVKVNYTYKDANGVDKPYPANDESRAAFFAKETFTVTESFSETVVLKRPFAQLNFGTTTLQSDLSGNVKVNTSKVTVSKAATVFNVAAGVGSVPTSASVVFDAAAIPADPTMLKVNNVDYHYLSMNYFLVDGESDNISVSAEFATEFGTVAHSIVEVPVAENYRTNILGDLLFSKADLKIIVDEDFNKPDLGNMDHFMQCVANGGEYTVLDEIFTLNPAKPIVLEKELTINLNGKLIVGPQVDIMFRIADGGSLILNGPGGIMTNGYIASANEGGKIIVNGGKYTSYDCTCFQANGGKVFIQDGSFTAVVWKGTYYTLNHIDAMNQIGLIEVTGGTFYNFNPADNHAESPQMSFLPVAGGYKVESEEVEGITWFTVVPE